MTVILLIFTMEMRSSMLS